MGLPQAIKDQEVKADQLVGQLAKGELVDVIVDDPSKVKDPEKKETPAPAPAAAADGTVSQADYDALNQKYSVLQGKYNHETAELRRTVDQANTTITRQNQMILDLHTRVNALEKGGGDGDIDTGGQTQPPAAQPAQKGPKKLNPADFEGYGSEMKDLVDGFNSLLEENATLKGTVAKSQEDSATQAFNSLVATLKSRVLDYDAVNFSEAFHGWLTGRDPGNALTRKQNLEAFVGNHDVEEILSIINRFKADPSSGYTGAAVKTPTGPKKEDIVQPAASAAGADSPIPGAADKGEVSVEQYNQAVKDYTQKRISYEEFEKISDSYQRGLAKKTGKK